uniref:Uncharacterized protein n=1 Tax=Arundo donax TaxID=35708 RepID=A0A0A9D8A0_ARUDO
MIASHRNSRRADPFTTSCRRFELPRLDENAAVQFTSPDRRRPRRRAAVSARTMTRSTTASVTAADTSAMDAECSADWPSPPPPLQPLNGLPQSPALPAKASRGHRANSDPSLPSSLFPDKSSCTRLLIPASCDGTAPTRAL